jgi:hypothetical protein
MKYSLQEFTNITFNGFDFKIPEDTLNIITNLSQQVGSPTYIKTPIFSKKEQPDHDQDSQDIFKRKKRMNNKPQEIINDSDWESIRTFQATKIEHKEGLDAKIDIIRCALNKMSEKNYIDQSKIILDILNQLIECSTSETEMMRVGNAIFEIASNNRFYSKLYADLYTLLIIQIDLMNIIFENNLNTFLEIFMNIEQSNPDEDYDKFCKVNKNNERRKSLSSFFVNLTINNIISNEKITDLTCKLMNNLVEFISQENKKSEVDELVENIFILYNKEWMDKCSIDIQGDTFINQVKRLAHTKAKTFPSLSNKAIFKFMDMIEM